MSFSAIRQRSGGVRGYVRANLTHLIHERMRRAATRDRLKLRKEYREKGATGYKADAYAVAHGLYAEAAALTGEYNRMGRGACTQVVYEAYRACLPAYGDKFPLKPVGYSRFLHIIKEVSLGGNIYDIVTDHRGGNHKRAESPIFRQWLLQLMESGKAYNVPYMHHLICQTAAQCGYAPPSLSWVNKAYGELLNCAYRARYGSDANHYGQMPYARLIQAQNPDAQWQIDGWRLPFYMEGFRTLTIFAVMDAFSKKILGYSIGETENTEIIMQALEMAVKNAGALPVEIVSDNHSFNKTKEAANLKEEFAARGVTWTVSSNPRYKSLIERSFGTFGNGVCKPMYGYIGEGIRTRRKNGRTSQELIDKYTKSGQWLTREQITLNGIYAVNEWNERATDGQSPNALYESKETAGVEVDLLDTLRIFVRKNKVKVSRGQITIKRGGEVHEYQLTAKDIARLNNNHVTLRYSSYNQIYVFDVVTDDFICCIQPRLRAHAALADQTEADARVLMGQKKRREAVAAHYKATREAVAAEAENVDPRAAYAMNQKLTPKNVVEDFRANGELRLQAERMGIDVDNVPDVPVFNEVTGERKTVAPGRKKGASNRRKPELFKDDKHQIKVLIQK